MKANAFLVNPLSVIGTSMSYAVVTCMVCNALRLSGEMAPLASAAFFVLFALPYFAMRFPKARILLAGMGNAWEAALAVVSTVPALLYLIGDACQDPTISRLVLLVAFALLGLVTSLQLSQWFNRLSIEVSEIGTTPITTALSFGVFAAFVILLLDDSFRHVALFALPVISAFLLAFITVRVVPEKPKAELGPSVPIELDGHTHRVLFIYQFAASFCLSQAYQHGTIFTSALAICLSFVICVSFQNIRKRFSGTIGETAKVYLPLLMVMLFGTLSDNPYVAAGTLVMGGAFYLYQGLSNQVFLANLAIHFKTNLLANMSIGRFPPIAGFASGMCAGIAYSWALPQLGADARLIAPALIAAAVAALYAFLPFNAGNPIKDGIVNDPAKGIEKPWEPNEGDEMESFRRRCAEISDDHSFTPREAEVFQLLARGYNTESIADILVVSPSTVKTHVYRIYRKLEVHSQQDIIAWFHPEEKHR